MFFCSQCVCEKYKVVFVLISLAHNTSILLYFFDHDKQLKSIVKVLTGLQLFVC